MRIYRKRRIRLKRRRYRARRFRKFRRRSRFIKSDARRVAQKSNGTNELLCKQETLYQLITPYPDAAFSVSGTNVLMHDRGRLGNRLFVKGLRLNLEFFNISDYNLVINVALIQKQNDEDINISSCRRDLFTDATDSGIQESFVDWADLANPSGRWHYKFAKINSNENRILMHKRIFIKPQRKPLNNSTYLNGTIGADNVDINGTEIGTQNFPERNSRYIQKYFRINRTWNWETTYGAPMHAPMLIWWVNLNDTTYSILVGQDQIVRAKCLMTLFYKR